MLAKSSFFRLFVDLSPLTLDATKSFSTGVTLGAINHAQAPFSRSSTAGTRTRVFGESCGIFAWGVSLIATNANDVLSKYDDEGLISKRELRRSHRILGQI